LSELGFEIRTSSIVVRIRLVVALRLRMGVTVAELAIAEVPHTNCDRVALFERQK
jgi:hypothetical protein